MLSIGTILGIINWCLVFIAILIYLTIFLILSRFCRELRDVSLLLTCNTLASAFLTCVTSCVMISSDLFTGFLTYNMTFCFAWGLFYDMFECSIYFSYCLQGFYRLCRVVFYKKRFLLSHSLYVILIICQWLFTLVLLLPPVFINWYTRLPTDKFCLIPYTYLGPEIYHIIILYLIPLVSLATVYIWITSYMRGISQTSGLVVAVVQRQRNQRDLTVIKRIIMMMSILIVLRFPTIVFMIYAAITGSLYPSTYGIVGIITSVCLILIGIITIYITPQLRKRVLVFFGQYNNQEGAESRTLNQRYISMAAVGTVNITQRSKTKDVPLEQYIP
jgi:hypothetical protein